MISVRSDLLKFVVWMDLRLFGCGRWVVSDARRSSGDRLWLLVDV